MPPKRKWNQTEDDESDLSLGNQALPVANLPNDFSGEPEDGAQYLFLVRRDARSLPNTTRVTNPYHVPDAPSTSPTRKPPHPCIPSQEWRTSFEETFKIFRQAWRTAKASASSKASSHTPKVPSPKDREGWLHYINGTSTSVNKPQPISYPPSTAFTPRSVIVGRQDHSGSKAQQSVPGIASNIQTAGIIDDEDIKPSLEDVEETPIWEPRRPTPSIIKNMNDHATIHLLMFIAHWIRKSLESVDDFAPSPASTRPAHFPQHHQQWAFSLLAQLDTSLRSEDISHLREIARACIATIRQDLEADGPMEVEVDSGVSLSVPKSGQPEPTLHDQVDHSSRYAHLTGTWMIIGAIASVWGQRDMWQDAEETLADLVVAKPRSLLPKPTKNSAGASVIPPALDHPDSDADVVLNYG